MADELAPPDGTPGEPAVETTLAVGAAPDTPEAAPAPAEEPARLYAGKYRTDEELEAAYLAAERHMHEATTRAAEAERKAQEALRAQQPSQPEPKPDPDTARWERLTPFYQTRLESYKRRYESDYVRNGQDPADAKAWAEEAAKEQALADTQAQFDSLKYADEQAQAASKQAREEALQSVAPFLGRMKVQAALERAKVADVSPDDIEQTVMEIARESGQDPEAARHAVAFQDEATLRVLALAARGRKAIATPPPPPPAPQRAGPQRPVGTGPGTPAATPAPGREELELAQQFKAQGWFSNLSEEDANTAAMDAARDYLAEQGRGR